jgi:hypothetical protein
MLHTVYMFKKLKCCQVTRWHCGSAYNLVEGSIQNSILFSHLVECMDSYNIRRHTFYEFNGLNI